MMKTRLTPAYRRSLKLYKKKHYPIKELDECLTALMQNDIDILKKHKAHKLSNHFELHITANWLLIYNYTKEGELVLILIDLIDHDMLRNKRY